MKNNRKLTIFLISLLISSIIFVGNLGVAAVESSWALGPIHDISRTDDAYDTYMMPGEMAVSGDYVYTTWLGLGYGAPSGYSVLFSRSTNKGVNFNTPIVIGYTSETAARIVASGSNVYVAWIVDGVDTSSSIYFTRSLDYGATFSTPVELIGRSNSSFDNPEIAVSGSHVYVAGKQWDFGNQTDNVLFMASDNEGTDFNQTLTLRTSDIVQIQHLTITASGYSVFVGWDERFLSANTYDVLVIGSTDYGNNFGSAVNLSNNYPMESSFEPHIAISGSYVYVFYISYYRPSYFSLCRVDLASSSNNGTSFGLASSPGTYGNYAHLQLYASGGNVAMAWDMDTYSQGSVYFATSTDYGTSMSTPITLKPSDGIKGSRLPRMAVSGTEICLAWITESFIQSADEEGYLSIGKDVYTARSTDFGATFGDLVDVSGSGEASNPAIALSGGIVTIAWQDPSVGNEEIFSRVGGVGLTLPDYAMSSLPSSFLMRTSQVATSQITVQSIQGFNDAVDFRSKWLIKSSSNLNYQLSDNSLTPPSNGATSTTLTVTTNAAQSGSSILRITGLSRVDGIVSHVKLSINIPDFRLSAWGFSLSPKQSYNSSIMVQGKYGFNDSVDLSAVWVGDQPSGVTFEFLPGQVNASDYTSILRVDASAIAQTGEFTLNVTGYSSQFGLTRYVAIQIDIADFTVKAEPSTLSMGSNQKANSIITVTAKGGFSNYVDLTTSWIGEAPGANVTVTLNSTSLYPSDGVAYAKLQVSTLDLHVNGTYTLRVTGTSGDRPSHSDDITLKITVYEKPAPAPTGNGTPSIVVKIGDFKSPKIQGLTEADSEGYSPDKSAQVHTYNIGSSIYLYLERTKDQVKIVPDTINPSVWGFGPDGKTFVLVTILSANQFRLSLYDISNNRQVINQAVDPLAWAFSPDGKYFVLDTGSSAGPQYQFQLSVYDVYKNKKTIDMPVSSYIPPAEAGDKIKTVGSGFSPDGKTFLLAKKNDAYSYSLLLLSSTTGNTILSYSYRRDVAAFWQFSPGSDLFMFVTQAGSTPSSTDRVYFHFTSDGDPYTPSPPGEVFLNPSATKQSAKVVKTGDDYFIELTGMSAASMPYPLSTTSVSAHSPVNIVVTNPEGLRTGYDPVTNGTINQIPGATYSGIGSEPQTVTLPYFNGSYTIEAYGLGNLTSAEGYTLTIETTAGSGDLVNNETITGNATANSYIKYAFELNEEGNVTIGATTANTAPSAVVLSSVSDNTETSLKLSWTASSDLDFKNYTIYMSSSSGNLGSAICTITNKSTLSYLVGGLSADTTYYFTVRVYDEGDLYADSNVASGKTKAATTPGTDDTPAANTAPSSVTLGTITNITPVSMTLSWSASSASDFKSYIVYMSSAQGSLGSAICTINNKATTTYMVENLSPDTTYYFTVRVYDTADLYSSSNVVSAKTAAQNVNTAPSAVTVNDKAQVTNGSLTLTWAASSDLDFKNYTVYMSNSSGSLGSPIYTSADKDVTSYLVSGLSPDTTYYFTVRVYDLGGLYADSNIVSSETLTETTNLPWSMIFIATILAAAVLIGALLYLKRDTIRRSSR